MSTATRRRSRAWSLALALAVALLPAVFLIGDYLLRSKPLVVEPLATHVVRPGDTLWEIAVTDYPERDPREVVQWIVEHNDVDPGKLRVGRVLVVPRTSSKR